MSSSLGLTFANAFISKNNITKFTLEIEENGSLSFLDRKISSENNELVTSVYRKTTFSGILTNFERGYTYITRVN